ncbi:hypothetical protein F3Y22_tig00110678pilonHSYRG00038 [Hibiscus syriacus]|uniref:Uncharacterized protein n=1 Tax=Hibiscus syriacus TaxID=106335 RepID=A0A6A2ZVF4_HIBSY|nr:hypothetical protein F3Y22_tig00110678pilonHSYRG00038 [Hibiscus syriacus]
MGVSESVLSASSPSSADRITTILSDRIQSIPFYRSSNPLELGEGTMICKNQVCHPVNNFCEFKDGVEVAWGWISAEEIEDKIEVANALAIKLLHSLNYSVSTMKTTSQHLSGVHTLQVELGELKGRLTEVLSNYDTLCKRIASKDLTSSI